MSKATDPDKDRAEYNFSDGVRGKHHHAYAEGTNLVLLEPDVANVFKDSDAVNHALRMLMDLADREIDRNLNKG